MGARHGAYCLACCWALMLLLFLGGVMNLMWVGAITVFVLVEKAAPFGKPAARVVDPQAPDRDLTVWIATNPATRKVEEIRKNPRVSLMYFDATGLEYAMLAGTVTIVADRAEIRRHWKPEWKPFYAKGPDGDDIILLRVRPTRVEVVSPTHKLVNDAKTWRPVGVDLP